MNELLNEYGLIAIFLFIFLEYACFPLPSEVLLPLSGGIASKLNVSFLWLIFSSSIAALLGSYACYVIGVFGGGKALKLIETKFPKTKKGIESSKEKYQKHTVTSTFFLRLVPICRTYISFVAGMYKANFLLYTISTFLGAFLWNTILIGIGYYAIGNMGLCKDYYDKYKYIVLLVIGVSIITTIYLKEKKRTKG